jgi:dUTP pyrophosphatase
MEHIKVLIKRIRNNEDITTPGYMSLNASGMDLFADIKNDIILNSGDIQLIPTGISIAIPEGYEAQIRPRSGIALNFGVSVLNSPGTIDPDYRGEIGVILFNFGEKAFKIKRGDRIAQLVFSRTVRVEWEEVKELDETIRGKKGFGHTGLS